MEEVRGSLGESANARLGAAASRSRAAIACTPADHPMMKATAIKLAKLPMPTAARDGAPRYPTIAVSTRLRTFCEAMPPMIGRARARMVRMRAEFSMRTP